MTAQTTARTKPLEEMTLEELVAHMVEIRRQVSAELVKPC